MEQVDPSPSLALLLQQHDFEIVYRPGTANTAPDALSRHPLPVTNAITPQDLRQEQQADDFCKSAPFHIYHGLLLYEDRPVLPLALRNNIFTLLHQIPSAGHLRFQ
ncbi:hypothetical protein BGW37DRAFT_500994 [Umbelopsis sp. PMI_123]|nr:hypothetical protein BGW37DRAFT_500994 [Umbelopsis sp. PMI_123]